MKNRSYGTQRPTLRDLQAAMDYGKPAEGFAHPPDFMAATPRAVSTAPRKHEEHDSQSEVVTYLRKCCPNVLVAASLNGELWPMSQHVEKGKFFGWMNKLKNRGMLTGDPDLRLTWFPSRCIFIEKKRAKGAKLEGAQIEIGKKLKEQGFPVYVLEGGVDQLREIIRAENIPCLES